MPNPSSYDTFFEDFERQRLQEQGPGIAAASTLTTGTDPDAVGRARAVARYLGVPAPVVEALPMEAQQQAELKKINTDTAAAPVLRQRYTDADFMKLARDDSATLAGIERVMRKFIAGGALKPREPSGPLPPRDSRGEIRQVQRSPLGTIIEPIRRGFAQGDRGLTMLLGDMGVLTNRDDLGVRLANQQRQVERFPMPQDIQEGMQAISQAPTMGSAFGEIVSNPRAVLEVALQSLGASAPALAAAVVGSTAGPVGTAAGAGAGSFAVEYSSTLQDVLADRGIDGQDPLALANALGNQELMGAAREKAVKRGVPIALFDAITAGLAGWLLAGARPTVMSIGGRAAGELALQGAGGAAGEATAQAVTGEYKPGDILMEAFAEVPSALVEAPANIRHARQHAVAMDIPSIGGSVTLAFPGRAR
jgi:hypothetical protein